MRRTSALLLTVVFSWLLLLPIIALAIPSSKFPPAVGRMANIAAK